MPPKKLTYNPNTGAVISRASNGKFEKTIGFANKPKTSTPKTSTPKTSTTKTVTKQTTTRKSK